MLHADLTLLLHTHQVVDGACFLVYRLHALHAGTALVIAYLCCRRDRLPLWRMGLPLLLSTCFATGLPTHASFHVNVYALITPPPWSILSLFQPPLQRNPSVVTVVTLESTYWPHWPLVSFAHLCGARPKRASLSLPFCAICPRYGALPVLGTSALWAALFAFAFCFVFLPLWRAARAGQLFVAFLPDYGARPELASLS